MNVEHERCCGLDVHKRSVTACRVHTAGGRVVKETRTVETMTDALLELLDWLLSTADAVVWSTGSAVAADPRFVPAQIRRAYPHLTVTSITPFGLEGPWRDRPAHTNAPLRRSPCRAPCFRPPSA